MAKTGEIKGLKKLLKDLVALGDEGREVVESVTMITAEEIARDAKIHAKVGDTGKLQQSIKAIEVDDLNWKVFANATGLAPYAAYVEFGTGGLVEVPDELKEMAEETIKLQGAGLALDYALAFLDSVNWYEIADNINEIFELVD